MSQKQNLLQQNTEERELHGPVQHTPLTEGGLCYRYLFFLTLFIAVVLAMTIVLVSLKSNPAAAVNSPTLGANCLCLPPDVGVMDGLLKGTCRSPALDLESCELSCGFDNFITSGSMTVQCNNGNWSSFVGSCIATYRLVGSISGLQTSDMLVVGVNDGQNLTTFPNSNPSGTFTFKNKFPDGFQWAISIKQQPQSTVCTVNTATGTFRGDDNLDPRISCIVQYTIGGTVTGLYRSPVVVAQSSTRDTVEVAANGPFTFPTAVAPGTSYTVTIQTQPSDANCVVARGTGVANGPVDTISVTCT